MEKDNEIEQPRSNEELGKESFNLLNEIYLDFEALKKENPDLAYSIYYSLKSDLENSIDERTGLRFQDRLLQKLNERIILDENHSLPRGNFSMNTDRRYYFNNNGKLTIEVHNYTNDYGREDMFTFNMRTSSREANNNEYKSMNEYSNELKNFYQITKQSFEKSPFEKKSGI